MWFGTMSRIDAEPARVAERAQRALAAELLRDPARVDDVVAVRRAVPRLEHRREVEVADAELAQVRARARARRRSVSVGAELEPVGRAQRRVTSRAAGRQRARLEQ